MMSSAVEYPAQHEGRLKLKNGQEIFLRPIMEKDENLVAEFFERLSPHSVYLRFLRNLHALPKEMLYRFTHIDYNREFALVAIDKEDGRDAIIAIACYAYTPDEDLPELAVVVRDDWQHLGLGKSLLESIITIGKQHGICGFAGLLDTQNKIIIQIFLKLGYDAKYTLINGFYKFEVQV